MSDKSPSPETKPDQDDKLTDKDLDQVAGGTDPSINPQPLPPRWKPMPQ